MANTTYILNQIKINGALEEIIAKSTGENVTVTYNGTEQPLASALSDVLAKINALPTGSGVDEKIKTAIDGLIDGAPAAYNTLKEISDYITEHGDVVKGLTSDIASKASKTDFDALKAAVDGLGALAAKDKVAEADLDTALAEKVNAAAEGNHSHANKAVLDGITAEKAAVWDAKAETTEATTGAAGLMSAADKTRLDGIRGVRYGASAPADMQDGELFIKVNTPAELPDPPQPETPQL